MGARSLVAIFKAYDVRGIVPDDLDVDAARRIGSAFATWSGAPRIAIGRDCRLSSPDLAAALAEGIAGTGADVVDLGLALMTKVAPQLNAINVMFPAKIGLTLLLLGLSFPVLPSVVRRLTELSLQLMATFAGG